MTFPVNPMYLSDKEIDERIEKFDKLKDYYQSANLLQRWRNMTPVGPGQAGQAGFGQAGAPPRGAGGAPRQGRDMVDYFNDLQKQFREMNMAKEFWKRFDESMKEGGGSEQDTQKGGSEGSAPSVGNQMMQALLLEKTPEELNEMMRKLDPRTIGLLSALNGNGDMASMLPLLMQGNSSDDNSSGQSQAVTMATVFSKLAETINEMNQDNQGDEDFMKFMLKQVMKHIGENQNQNLTPKDFIELMKEYGGMSSQKVQDLKDEIDKVRKRIPTFGGFLQRMAKQKDLIDKIGGGEKSLELRKFEAKENRKRRQMELDQQKWATKKKLEQEKWRHKQEQKERERDREEKRSKRMQETIREVAEDVAKPIAESVGEGIKMGAEERVSGRSHSGGSRNPQRSSRSRGSRGTPTREQLERLQERVKKQQEVLRRQSRFLDQVTRERSSPSEGSSSEAAPSEKPPSGEGGSPSGGEPTEEQVEQVVEKVGPSGEG